MSGQCPTCGNTLCICPAIKAQANGLRDNLHPGIQEGWNARQAEIDKLKSDLTYAIDILIACRHPGVNYVTLINKALTKLGVEK